VLNKIPAHTRSETNQQVAPPEVLRLHTIDNDGVTWTIRAETIELPFRGHQFVVHRSLALDGPAWSVSHFQSGALVVAGETKIEVIEAAQAKLRTVTEARITEIAQDALRRRNELVQRWTDGPSI
jgi:hypothetical protein